MTEYEGQNEIRNIKRKYKNTIDREKVLTEFYIPCVKYCKVYKRAAGYFSTSVFSNWVFSLDSFVRDEKEVFLITSPILSASDKEALNEIYNDDDKEKYQIDKIEKSLIDFVNEKGDAKFNFSKELFKWLIAKNKLHIKFAIPIHVENASIYHDKGGVFKFPNSEDKVAFTGSSNESMNGLVNNSDKIKIFRSWEEKDFERVLDEEEEFEEDWNGQNKGIKTFDPSERFIKKIIEYAPENIPKIEFENDGNSFNGLKSSDTQNDPILHNNDERYDFQDDFSKDFIDRKRGYFEMATGTGKTFLAMKIIEKARIKFLVNSVIIVIPSNHLLYQWCDENIRSIWFNTRKKNEQEKIIINEDSDRKREYEKFLNYFHEDDELFSVLICNYHNLEKILKYSSEKNNEKTLLIFDEVHNLTSQKRMEKYSEYLKKFSYKLGLSATIDHKYDSDRKDFIINYIGPEIGKINLGDAINKKILSPFRYIVSTYELNEEESHQKHLLIRKYNKLKNDPNSTYKKEQFYQDIARIHAKAHDKKEIFMSMIKTFDNYKYLKNCFIFFSEKEDAREIVRFINTISEIKCKAVLGDEKGMPTQDDTLILEQFKNGKLDCLVMCLKLSEGISINKLENMFMFYADSNNRLTTQRIGRVLRLDKTNPNKIANVFDFELQRDANSEYNPDRDRKEWLYSISFND